MFTNTRRKTFVSSILISMKCLPYLRQGFLSFILVSLFGMETTTLLALLSFFTGSQNNNLKSITRHLATQREHIKYASACCLSFPKRTKSQSLGSFALSQMRDCKELRTGLGYRHHATALYLCARYQDRPQMAILYLLLSGYEILHRFFSCS